LLLLLLNSTDVYQAGKIHDTAFREKVVEMVVVVVAAATATKSTSQCE